MGNEKKGMMRIRYVNGSEQTFEFARQQDDARTASRIHQALSENQLMLELEDRVFIIPFASIQSIEISPPPDKLPANALRNVKLIG